MNTIALRFGEHFAPKCGTIAAHQAVIDKIGYVWYGKMGAKASEIMLKDIIASELPRVLLINSGKSDRYWAYIEAYTYDMPNPNEYPSYYGEKLEKMNTWIKIVKFEIAPKDIMSKCKVISSGATLGEASKHSMSPYFKIQYDEEAR